MSQCPFLSIPSSADPAVRMVADDLQRLQYFINSGANLAYLLAQGGKSLSRKTPQNATQSYFIRGDDEWIQAVYQTDSHTIRLNHINAGTLTSVENLVDNFSLSGTSLVLTTPQYTFDQRGHVISRTSNQYFSVLTVQTMNVMTGFSVSGSTATLTSHNVTVFADNSSSSSTVTLPSGTSSSSMVTSTISGSYTGSITGADNGSSYLSAAITLTLGTANLSTSTYFYSLDINCRVSTDNYNIVDASSNSHFELGFVGYNYLQFPGVVLTGLSMKQINITGISTGGVIVLSPTFSYTSPNGSSDKMLFSLYISGAGIRT